MSISKYNLPNYKTELNEEVINQLNGYVIDKKF